MEALAAACQEKFTAVELAVDAFEGEERVTLPMVMLLSEVPTMVNTVWLFA